MSEVVNIQDKSGDTALNIAARINNRSIVCQLIEVGADASIANKSNLSPIDFGVGDPADFEARIGEDPRGLSKPMDTDVKESSSEIITGEFFKLKLRFVLTIIAITTLVTETELEFSKEMDKKQAVIDDLHMQLRDASGELGEQRRRLEGLQAEMNERESRKRKTSNLMRSYEDEGSHLSQLQAEYGQVSSDSEAQLGDADTGLGISPKASPVLSKVTSDHQGPIINGNERQFLASALPPLHTLRARVNAYAENNKALEANVRGLQSKSSELANKYRTIIGLCTGVDDTKVDEQLDNLLRAVESEPTDVELARVREFLVRIES
jgi:hypothetical protein